MNQASLLEIPCRISSREICPIWSDQNVIVECLSKDKHGADLYEIYGPDSPADMWTYLFQNPVQSQEEWSALLDQMLAAQDRFYYAIVDKESGRALGTFALMRINRGSRVIEVGSVTYSPPIETNQTGDRSPISVGTLCF